VLAAFAAMLIPATSASAGSFTGVNTTSIAIPATGAATPYPTQIPVSGLTGTISSVGIGLRGYTEPNPSGPVEIALVSPSGRALLLMAGVGTSATAVDLDLNDQAASQLPGATGPLASGSYKPADYAGSPAPNFPSPGPGTSYGDPGPQHSGNATFASMFGGDNPNGNWDLYVNYSSVSIGPGTIAGGWQLTLSTVEPQPIPPAKKTKKCKKKHKKRSASAAKKCKKKKKKG